jgi:A/G-specific adenine glycosylase
VVKVFQNIIYSYYKQYGRDFPFRRNITPYNVLVSEIMLQQTQTATVSEKFLNFIKIFPDFETLAKSPLDRVLKAWQGLGYNRRAIALKNIAEKIIYEFDGKFPENVEVLKKFPQIGHNTASSIATFAFNKETYFIETNIRRVFIYFFFHNRKNVNDKEILPLVKATTDKDDPRKWYYALMDYGVMLKRTHPELNKQSAHYKKQKPFKGSNREIRGNILRILLKKKTLEKIELYTNLNFPQHRIDKVLEQLEKEGFISVHNELIKVAE